MMTIDERVLDGLFDLFLNAARDLIATPPTSYPDAAYEARLQRLTLADAYVEEARSHLRPRKRN